MKTLSDFKKRIKVGQKIETIHEKFGSFGIRTISKVQTNSFAMLTEKYADKAEPFPDGPKDSWCHYPKAKDFEIIDENTVAIYWGEGKTREKILTYRFVNNNSIYEQK